MLDFEHDWDEDHPINQIHVTQATDRPEDCDTATASFIFAESSSACSELLASVTASCMQGGGLLRGEGCLDWGVEAVPVDDDYEKPAWLEFAVDAGLIGSEGS